MIYLLFLKIKDLFCKKNKSKEKEDVSGFYSNDLFCSNENYNLSSSNYNEPNYADPTSPSMFHIFF